MVNFKVISDLQELPAFDATKPVFADVETEQLYIGNRLIQLYQPETSDTVFIIDLDDVAEEEAKEFIKPLWTVWWGISYDFGTLHMSTAKFDDLQYMARIAYPAWKSYKLDDVVDTLGLGEYYEGLDKKKLQKAGFVRGAYLSQSQLRYAATDVYVLKLLWDNSNLLRASQTDAYKLDIHSVRYCIHYQQNGLIPDRDAIQVELKKLEGKIADNYAILGNLNPNSPKQVRAALGTESSDKPTLIRLISQGNELARAVFDQRRLLKRRTMLRSYDHDKVYTFFNPNGAVTSRFTATGGDLDVGINAQQIPRDYQYIFNTDTEETVVIHADYSTAELRAGASIMRDETMYQELKDGKDLHVEAAILAGVPREAMVKSNAEFKENRQKGKSVSFGKIFGQSWKSFIEYAYVNYGVVFTEKESKATHDAYTSKYKGIFSYQKARWNDYKTRPVCTPLGHRNMANLGTDAINYATQGGVAETTKLAVHYLVKEYPIVLDYIYNVVHDAIYLRVPRGEEELWAPRLGKAMKKGWEQLCKTPMMYYKDIPMPIEVEYLDKCEVF